ncbi:hypothetical protein K0M31_019786, partial [Melipona bicolor]
RPDSYNRSRAPSGVHKGFGNCRSTVVFLGQDNRSKVAARAVTLFTGHFRARRERKEAFCTRRVALSSVPQPREQPTVSGRPNGSAIVRSCVRKWRATRISRSADRRACCCSRWARERETDRERGREREREREFRGCWRAVEPRHEEVRGGLRRFDVQPEGWPSSLVRNPFQEAAMSAGLLIVVVGLIAALTDAASIGHAAHGIKATDCYR